MGSIRSFSLELIQNNDLFPLGSSIKIITSGKPSLFKSSISADNTLALISNDASLASDLKPIGRMVKVLRSGVLFKQNILNDSVSKFSTDNKSRYLNNPLRYIPQIEDLEILWEKDAKDFYAGNYRVHSYHAWRIYSDSSYYENKKKFLYSNFWHFDDLPKNLLKVFILLSDNVGKDSGATRVIDVPTSKKLTRTFKFVDYALPSIITRMVDEYVYSNNKINYFGGNKGDIYICNTPRCLHAATIPENGKIRDLIQIELYPS